MGVRIGKRAEFIAVQQFRWRACALQQHHLHAALRHLLFKLRQHGAVRGDAGAGANQQVALIGIVGVQAEASKRAAGLQRGADVQCFKQGGSGAAGHIADRDIHLRVGRGIG